MDIYTLIYQRIIVGEVAENEFRIERAGYIGDVHTLGHGRRIRVLYELVKRLEILIVFAGNPIHLRLSENSWNIVALD